MPFSSPPSPQLSVLIVDDIASTRMILAALVNKLGYRTLQAEDGEHALSLFDQAQPDMVLLDLLMPGMDGFEVMRRMKAKEGNKWVPVVVLSGLDGEQHLLAALEAGADDFLHKPAEPAILSSKLKNLSRVLVLQQQHAALLNKSLAMSENSFDAILVVGSDENIQGLNLAAERLLQADRDVMRGRSVRMVLPHVQLEVGSFDATQGQLQSTYVYALTAERIPVEVGLSLFYQGGERFWLLILRDISERERVDRLKQQFIATLSHELRTPLTSIIGSLKLLQNQQFASVDQRATPLIEMADRNAARLLHMVNELLDLNKAAAGALQLEINPYPVSVLLDEILHANQGYADTYSVKLMLKSELGECIFLTDKMRFGQIFANLISNACKYSSKGSEVIMSAQLIASRMQISVRDHGPGISDAFLPSLFEPFAQADASDSRLRGGTGLGLAICRQLCSALGGSIRYQPAAGGGSEFIVEFSLEGVQ